MDILKVIGLMEIIEYAIERGASESGHANWCTGKPDVEITDGLSALKSLWLEIAPCGFRQSTGNARKDYEGSYSWIRAVKAVNTYAKIECPTIAAQLALDSFQSATCAFDGWRDEERKWQFINRNLSLTEKVEIPF